MGLVYAEITLINGEDLILAKRNIIGEDEIKKIKVKAITIAGGCTLTINQTIQEYLRLPVIEKRKTQMADTIMEAYDIAGPVEVLFKNNRNTCSTKVLPCNNQPLIGTVLLQGIPIRIRCI
jgi:hypothetical protein